MTYFEKSKDLHDMIMNGQLLEGFDKYYHEDVVMTEPRGTREGKKACREYEEQFLGMIKEFHGMDIKAMAANEETGQVFIESGMDVTFQDGNRANLVQVSVQKWEGDQIVREEFYYDNQG